MKLLFAIFDVDILLPFSYIRLILKKVLIILRYLDKLVYSSHILE